MKTSIHGFLVALALGLASAPALPEEPVQLKTAAYTENLTPRVEVVEIDQEQAARLLSERKRHQEALEKLNEEHERTVEAILASSR